MHPTIDDIGAFITGVFGRIPAVITAGAGNDGVEVIGPYHDRTSKKGMPRSCKVMVIWEAAIGAGESLSIAANLEDATSSGGAGTANFGTVFPNTIVQLGGAGGTFRGVTEFSVDLAGARQFIAAAVTANLSRATTDTVAIATVIVLGGGDTLPQT